MSTDLKSENLLESAFIVSCPISVKNEKRDFFMKSYFRRYLSKNKEIQAALLGIYDVPWVSLKPNFCFVFFTSGRKIQACFKTGLLIVDCVIKGCYYYNVNQASKSSP